MTPPTDTSSRKRAVVRELAVAWLHLAVLWMFAFARPLFQVLEDSPEFFVARGNTTTDIVLLALGVAFVPPSLLVLCEALLFRWRRARQVLHLVFVVVLLAAIVLQALDGLASGPAWLLIFVSLGTAAAGAWAYSRTRLAPAMLTVLSPTPVLIVIYFLLLSPVSDLVLPQDVQAAGSGQGGSSTPVVFVVFDEFSGASLADGGGKLDASRFPNLAAFSADSTWYRNATTVADQTTNAVPALLAGKWPENGKLPVAADYPVNLFTALEDSHSLNVVEPVSDLCPRRLCSQDSLPLRSRLRSLADDLSVVSAYLLLPDDLEDGLPEVDRTFGRFREGGRDVQGGGVDGGVTAAPLENRLGQLEEFLGGIDGDTAKPQLDFLHIALPHLPWQYLPSGQSYSVSGPDPAGLMNERWSRDDWSPLQGYQRYLLQLGYVDRLLGRLFARLRAEGLYERSLIVLTADHGVSFRPDLNRRIIVPGNAPDIANVPMFVKEPGQSSGRVDEGSARTIDLFPTVAEATGHELDEELDGHPLGEPSRNDRVTVSSYTGTQVEMSLDEFVRRRDAEVKRRLRHFGEGFEDVFAWAPIDGLVGRQVRTLPTGGAAPYAVVLDYSSGLAAFSAGSTTVPAYVSGRLTGPVEGGELVALAVNGRVAAVTRSFTNGDEVRLGAIVSPEALRSGANAVQAFAVTGEGAGLRLRSAGSTGALRGRLTREGEQLLLALGDRKLRVTPGAVDGFLDAPTRTEPSAISGWASDTKHTRAADLVLLFSDGRLLDGTTPSVTRPDVARKFKTFAVGKSGFRFTGVPEAGDSTLVVVAVSGDEASILKPAP